MGTPMAFPGSVQTRKGAASCLLQASFAAPRRAARAARGKGEVRDLDLRRDLTDVRVVHGPRPALARSTRRSARERGESRSRKMAEGSGKLFEIFWSATMVVATRGGPFEISAIYMYDVLMDHLMSPSISRENTSMLTHGRQPCCCARAAQHSCRVSAGPV
jgi:hypothetical protein